MSRNDRKAKREEPDPKAERKARDRAYEAELARIQVEISHLQAWVKATG